MLGRSETKSSGISLRIFRAVGRKSGGIEKSSSTLNPDRAKGMAAAVIERMMTGKFSRMERFSAFAINDQNVSPSR
jgi:hypothetical protein